MLLAEKGHTQGASKSKNSGLSCRKHFTLINRYFEECVLSPPMSENDLTFPQELLAPQGPSFSLKAI